MKNFLINTCLCIVGLLIGNYIGGCYVERKKQEQQLLQRIEKLEGKK